ncbi:ABC-2 type transport system ATP-binding protein [Alkalibacillus flavidus]|uniref:ABC-2 type transport system ATP-binding protein n=1 Tax=Alkalibacillus flavidus TaxID=546021 RepID=A0ABV2KU23_9BACI
MQEHVEFHDVSLKIGRDTILEDINLTLEGGKTYGLLGRNGAGKTSLLSLLAAFRPASTGAIRLNGEKIFENPSAMQQICFSYDKDYSEETEKVKSLLKNLEFYRSHFDHEYADRLVERFNLPLNKAVSKLSTGMQSAFNVTIGLASRCPVTIFDESYLGMDAPTRDIFYQEILREQSEHPRIFILSTHLVSEMDHLFDDVIMIQNGRAVLHDDYETLMTKAFYVTGDGDAVERFSKPYRVLDRQQLGGTTSALIYTDAVDTPQKEAHEQGLDVHHVTLQDLFIHLTKEVTQDANS